MPEGDTLHITANTLRPALVGKVVKRIDFARLAGDSSILVGTTVIEVEAEGKNLLVRFDNALVLHTHLKMPGIWHLYRPGEAWRRAPSAARVVLEVEGFQAVCFSAPVVRVLKEGSVRRELAGLGPDLLAETFDATRAVSNLRALTTWPLGVAVMHQPAVAGIGNVYKSELLFLEQLNPFAPVSSVSDQALTALLARARDLMRRNVARPGQKRTTRFEGKSDATRVWVYRRKGMPCFRCGTTIRMKRQGEALRSTYFCPSCEGVTAEALAMLFGPGA